MMTIRTFIFLIALTAFWTAQFASAETTSPWLATLTHPSKTEQTSLRWTASGGDAEFQFFYTTLNQLGIDISNPPALASDGWSAHAQRFPIQTYDGLALSVPYGNLERVTGGALFVDAQLTLRSAAASITASQLRIVPAGELTFKVYDQTERLLFTMDHVHSKVDNDGGILSLANMDLRLSLELASQLGIKQAAGLVIGQVHLTTTLHIPAAALTTVPKGGSCAGRPLWPPMAEVDVALIGMSAQWLRNLSGGRIVIAPSATLKNVGAADVVWQAKFDPPVPPYSNDQHPYLNWAMYRLSDNRFEQIGRSGIKHAFFAVNQNCAINCNNNQILWPGCEDTYGVGTNDRGDVLGPRDEVAAFAGLWTSTGSFFDPTASGSQTNSSNDTDENRMLINESDLQLAGARYFISSWYTIRDDVNIYNTMGYREVTVSPLGNGWQVNPVADFVQGPALNAYVAPGSTDTTQLVQRTVTTQGHFAVAVSVDDLGGGRFRYHYAVDNYDFDPTFEGFSLPLSSQAALENFVFSDVDDNPSNDWAVARAGDELTITAPSTNPQRWGMLFGFSFTTTAAPSNGTLLLSSSSSSNGALTSNALVPRLGQLGALLFSDGFE